MYYTAALEFSYYAEHQHDVVFVCFVLSLLLFCLFVCFVEFLLFVHKVTPMFHIQSYNFYILGSFSLLAIISLSDKNVRRLFPIFCFLHQLGVIGLDFSVKNKKERQECKLAQIRENKYKIPTRPIHQISQEK